MRLCCRVLLAALLAAILFVSVSSAQAAPLTAAQKVTLKASILADPTLAADVTAENWDNIAAAYNAPASPAYIVWKSIVPIGEVGKTFNATELAGLTQLNTTRLQNLAQWLVSGVNPSLASVRQFFDDIFSGSGGANTRAALLALWKRSATRLEKLFATGTGSDASPATLVVEGAVSAQTVSDAIGGR